MNRRAFFASIAAAMTVDPEKLLWVPGKKLISVPKPGGEWPNSPGFWVYGGPLQILGYGTQSVLSFRVPVNG